MIPLTVVGGWTHTYLLHSDAAVFSQSTAVVEPGIETVSFE